MENSNTPPILLIIFNRPGTTSQVFEAIRKAKPQQLFIAADGARPSRSAEATMCAEARALTEKIDWPCQVLRKYSETNMGCDPHVESAINWFFEHVNEGIILEDDCVPDQSFFSFCASMLEKYSFDEKTMHINGSNFQFEQGPRSASYYFSAYPHSWGWATWKRAWKKYDPKMPEFPAFKESGTIKNILLTKTQQKFHLNLFKKLYQGKYSFWDSKWAFAIWLNEGKCITPSTNLISNIGHGAAATHTTVKERLHQESAGLGTITHPNSTKVDEQADNRTFLVYYYRSIFQKIWYRLLTLLQI